MSEFMLRIIDAFTPRDIPMARLAEYMTEFARLLGEQASVHFEAIVDRSVGVASVVEQPAVHKVISRVAAVGNGLGPDDALKAHARIDEMLANDNALGEVLLDGATIITFLGRTREVPRVYGPFNEDGALDGEVVRIGGTDDTIHVTLRDGLMIYSACVATVEIAKQLGLYLLGPYVRLHGTGRWVRHGDGAWELKHFRIRSFEVLEGTPLTDVVAKLRDVPGSGWPEVEDPASEIARGRFDDGLLN